MAIIQITSVVTHDVPPYSIVSGNPAQPIRQRFDKATIAALLHIAWWDWNLHKITQHLDKITAADLEGLGNCSLSIN